MKFKKIMSLLLVLTLIGTMLTTVTLLNPVAEDTEATTPTTNYDTHVLHVQGVSEKPTTGRGIYLTFALGSNIKVGETYTANVVLKGKALNQSYSLLIIKSGNGSAADAPTIASTNASDATKKGTTSSTYSGATKWSVNITPQNTNNLYLGIWLNSQNIQNADFYLGGFELLDKNGKNVAITLKETTTISAMSSNGGMVMSNADTEFFPTKEMVSIDNIQDAAEKQSMVNDFYNGDSMINFKAGTTAAVQSFFRRIPASKLKAGTTYKLSIRYSGSPAMDEYRYFLIREGNKRTISYNFGNITKLSGYVNCYEYTAEYTTGNTAQDLYIGVHMNQSGWGIADFTIADMKLVENGKTENLFTPLSDMSNYYRAASTSDSAAIQTLNSAQYISIVKQTLDRDKYFEPQDKEAAKYLLHAKGLAEPSTVRGILVQVPASRLTEGESYTVNVTLFGKALNSSYCVLTVQSGEAKSGLIAHTAASTDEAKGTITTTYSGATKWTVNITPDASKNIYIGMYMNKGNLTNADFYLGDIEVIDRNGNNIAPTYSPSSALFAFASWGGGVLSATDASEAGFFETREFIRLDKVADETLKQKLFDSYYNGSSMIELSSTTGYTVYKRIPKDSLQAETKYKLSLKYSGVTFGDYSYIVMRNNTEASSNIMTSQTSGEFIKHGTYTEYVNYFTTPAEEELTSLFIGFFINKDGWTAAGGKFYIADMQFVDVDGNNCFDSINQTDDLYCGYNAGAISKLTSSNTVVTVKKQVLDTEKFSEPVSTDRKMINVSGLTGGNNAKFYVKVPHLLAGTYRATYKIKGIDLVDGRYFDVRTNTPMATHSSEIVAGPTISSSVVARPSIDESTYEFTTTDFSDVYLGFTIPMKHVTAMNFYIEKLELVRIVDGVASENLIDDNLNITKFSRHNANNGESEAWTTLTVGTNGSVSYNTVFKLSVMDYDESILYPSQIVNLKGGEEQSQNYQYAKKASNLKAGTYRVTLIEQGANIKTSTNQRFWVDLNGSQIVNTYWENGREYVETFGTSSYKFQYDVTVEEDGASVMGGFTIGYTYMPEFNAYITEISLVKIDEQGNAISENLFSDLNVRDWCGEAGTLLGIEKYGSTSVRLKNIDLGVADTNGNGVVDVADIRILSKMQDAGMILTEGVNDVTFVRNAVLNAAS